MIKKRKTTISAQRTGDGFIGRLFAQTKLPAHVTEEQDWYLDTPDVRLTRVFTVVLILHVVAVGGILAFKMVEKASTPAVIVAATPADASKTEAQPAAAAVNAAASEATPDAPAAVAAATGETPAQAPGAGETVAGTALLVDHPSAKDYQEYCVGAGETLVGIAQKLNVSASEILEINNLDSGANLTTGRWIRVPKSSKPDSAVAAIGRDTGEAPAAPAAPAAPVGTPRSADKTVAAPKPAPTPAAPTKVPAAAAGDRYQVQKGETLFSIARRFGVKYQDLMAANGIQKPENLQAGQTLRVPGH